MIEGNELSDALARAKAPLERETAVLAASILEIERELERLRAEETAAWTALARTQVDGGAGGLPPHVTSLLEERVAALKRTRSELEARSDEVAALSGRRDALAAKHAAAADAHRTRMDSLRAQLDALPEYSEAVAAATARGEASASMVRRQEESEASLSARRLPFERDELFAYLRRRGFGTPSYSAFWPFSALDARLADAVGYGDASASYDRLLSGARWLAERVERMRAEHGEASARVASLAERHFALAAPEAEAERLAAEALGQVDGKLSQARGAAELAEERLAAAAMGRDPEYRRAVEALAAHLSAVSQSVLEAMARRTAGTEDDEALAVIRGLGERRVRASARADELRVDLAGVNARLKSVREAERRLSGEGWDRRGHRFDAALGAGLAAALASGRLDASGWWAHAESTHRDPPPPPTREPAAIPPFAQAAPRSTGGGFGGEAATYTTGGGFGGDQAPATGGGFGGDQGPATGGGFGGGR